MNSATKVQKKDKKVAIYCRISTQMQSTDRQKEDLLAVAERFKYEIDADHIYIDIITGFSVGEERPNYSALLDEVDKGNIGIILFSELTRLGRNSTELLAEVQRLQDKGIDLYFDKQDLWVRHDKKDLGSRILLAVLAITTSYEIELFAERSISGKIEKLSKGGGVGGDNNAYEYMNDENKMMVIRKDEAEIIRRIFKMYADGKSTIDICDILNTEGVPTSYGTRIKEFKENRERKGLEPKSYDHFKDEDNFEWRPSAIAKLLCKELYKGHRVVMFHKPQVDKLEKKKGEPVERELIYMKTAVIYSRTSSSGYQQNRQDTSRQVADLKAYADYAHLEVRKVYEEHVSGASKQKPTLVEAIDYCKREHVDMLLVSELSRVGRNAFEVLATVKDLVDHRINMFMQKEQLTLLDEHGEPTLFAPIMIATLSTCAQLERDSISFRLNSGRKQYIENGGKLGRKKGSIKTREQKEKQYKEVLFYLRKDYSIRITAKLTNISVATVQRLKNEFEL